jgi:GTP-binding protein HflX
VPYPTVALVGYTNAGKSTLFNRLTNASVVAQDMLFATLDPTLRTVKLPDGRPAILSDTVGFISDLPHELVEAFRATLEEVQEADVVLHVRDVANPDTDAQARDVQKVLAELKVLGDDGEAEGGKTLSRSGTRSTWSTARPARSSRARPAAWAPRRSRPSPAKAAPSCSSGSAP